MGKYEGLYYLAPSGLSLYIVVFNCVGSSSVSASELVAHLDYLGARGYPYCY